VNLQGACGILVNISAGPNFSMREFDEIGRTIEEFASDDATIVIGTVLDPELQDEVRVTVVATGLNRQQALPRQSGSRDAVTPAVAERTVRMVRSANLGAPEFQAGAARANFRVGPAPSEAGAAVAAAGGAAAAANTAEDYLNIPAFLRRQAD
jgi:cell division protein FtsZ